MWTIPHTGAHVGGTLISMEHDASSARPAWVSEESVSAVREAVARLRSDISELPLDGVVAELEIDGARCTFALSCPVSLMAELSPREQEIVRMVARGYPNKTIAAVLDISCWTVNTHIRRIFAKLGVNTRAAMVARTSGAGLLATQGRQHAGRSHG